jgi:hypothetical protein
MTAKLYRQGDVLIVPAAINLDGAKPIQPTRNAHILAYGESTGHHHSVSTETCGLFDLAGKTVLVVAEPTPLMHQEHGAIEIAPGQYWVVIQREYTPQAIRRVTD